ncbi:hypothetical protein PR003_g34435, partial [Phytophthora rubi]
LVGKASGKKTKARPQAASKSKPSQGSSATQRSSAVADMPRATKKSGKTSGKNTNVRPRATSKSKPSQAFSEDTHHSKRKRGQDEDEVDGDSAKIKTARVTRNATVRRPKPPKASRVKRYGRQVVIKNFHWPILPRRCRRWKKCMHE